MLRGDTFDDSNEHGQGWHYRFRYSVISNESAAGQQMGLFQSQARAGSPGALPGRSASPPMHHHKWQTECFRVRQGVIGYLNGGVEGHVSANSTAAETPICVPPGVSHAFWNAQSDTDLHVDVTLTPPGNSEAYFRTLTGFAKDQGALELTLSELLWGGLKPGGCGPGQLLATFVAGDVVLEGVPRPLWWAIEKVAVPWFIIPVLGVDPLPPEYTAH